MSFLLSLYHREKTENCKIPLNLLYDFAFITPSRALVFSPRCFMEVQSWTLTLTRCWFSPSALVHSQHSTVSHESRASGPLNVWEFLLCFLQQNTPCIIALDCLSLEIHYKETPQNYSHHPIQSAAQFSQTPYSCCCRPWEENWILVLFSDQWQRATEVQSSAFEKNCSESDVKLTGFQDNPAVLWAPPQWDFHKHLDVAKGEKSAEVGQACNTFCYYSLVDLISRLALIGCNFWNQTETILLPVILKTESLGKL